ncbi:DNA gyrase subunit A, partial [Candidatus Curtissbacteria bacterium]|nr:DNA gyrase subunit A [Candidatus Curtissbacteria bacterium]
AVGMATNIPPHNLTEVTDAIIYLINNPDAVVEDLLKFIKGPDFPTGGLIYDQKEITAAYATGKGKIIMRAKADIEEVNNRLSIVVSELPYQVNKALLIARIAQLVKEKRLEGISDLRDESDRRGMQIAIELKKDARPQSILNQLYKHTSMQLAFNVNTVALVDGTPQTLTLKVILTEYIRHRQNVVTRRAKFDLEAAEKRAHILEGLKIAVSNIDAVIETIKKSSDSENAKLNLIKKFKLTEIQATAILDMQLRRLAALEREKIEEEYKETIASIARLKGLLSSPKKILQVIEKELTTLKEKYGDPRRTRVYKSAVGEFSEEDLVPQEQIIITITKSGYIKRSRVNLFRTQRRGGKGVSGLTMKDEDSVYSMLSANTHDQVLFFTNKGRVFQIRAYELPEGTRVAKGVALVNILDLEATEKITAVLNYDGKSGGQYLIMATKKGLIKKTKTSEFEHIRRSGMIAIRLNPSDELIYVRLTSGSD